ncbi:MAG: single-stranded DNA-binding protein [Oscillibacter sp.]|jgi:single-strand DNA-binding protein|nr:single-stranded DNA-binding protein [Oscillibacter sp.]
MLNKIILMGRLTRDPELRRTQSGTAVTSFSLAVDRDFKSQGGEKETDFIDIVAWRNTAEFVSKYFTKGRMAVVEGRLQIRDWTDKEGGKRRSAEVVADNVYFGDSKRDNADSSYGSAPAYSAPASRGASAAAPSDGHSDFAEISEEDGELPF